MSMINAIGTYRGAMQEHAVNLTKTGLPNFEAKLQAIEKYNFETAEWGAADAENCEITGFLVMFNKDNEPLFHVQDIMRVCEWDGRSLAELDGADLDGLALQWRVIEDTYDGKTRLKVAAIAAFDDTPGTGGVRKLDAESVKTLDAKFAAALSKLSGGPKPVSAKAPAVTKPAVLPPKAGKKSKVAQADPTTSQPKSPASDAPVVTESATAVKPAAENMVKPAAPKPPMLRTPPVPAKELTYEEAWEKCYGMKSKQTTDDELGAAFTAAVQRIAPDTEMEQITGAQWNEIANAVVAEHGVFA